MFASGTDDWRGPVARVFTEGRTAREGSAPQRVELGAEANVGT
ncbi:hypothetical protein ACFPM0_09390 [Pseudonocardia sulfidoxydans]